MYSSTISLNSSKYFQDSLDYYNEEQRGMYWFSDNKQGLNRGQAIIKHRIKAFWFKLIHTHAGARPENGVHRVCSVTQVTWVQNLTFGWYWSREKLSIFIFSFFIFSCVGIRAIIEQRSSSSCWRDDFSEEEKKFLENFLTNE